MKEPTLVLKFGGAAVSSPERFATIADVILDRKKEFPRIAVVVSAMGDTTDELIGLAKRVAKNPPQREMDMLVSVGERISIALLAMAIAEKDKLAVSFTGSQSGIITTSAHTNARIVEVRPHRLMSHLNNGAVVIIAGFQGMSSGGEITTLGRGGSDTSAVALGIALGAEKIEFFKDVNGVFDKDPNKFPDAKLFSELSYSDALNIVRTSGHQVLQERSILLAQKNQMPLHILPFDGYNTAHVGTWIGCLKRPAISPEVAYESLSGTEFSPQK